jgi:NAD(P)-dependent dehydrogenase (short-subunit alcohol dehydrogenase family)
MLIHNAGIYEEHDPQSCSAEETARVWHQTLSINLMAPAVLSPLFAQCHVTQGTQGVVVAVSSRGAFRGEPTAPGYGASKAGLNAMMQSMAKAFAPRGVYFYTVAPGWVETEMARGTLEGPRGAEVLRDQPMGRVAHPGEVASVVVYCALDAVPQMTGCIIDVNGASYLRT